MKQSRQGVRLTKVIDKDAMLEAEMHPKPIPGVKIKDVYLRVFNFDTGKLLEHRQLLRDFKHKEIWTKAGANEFGWLAQEVGGRIDGTWQKHHILHPQARNPSRQT